jgi:hypothetical protein
MACSIFNRFVSRATGKLGFPRLSFSQSGEDRLLFFLFRHLHIYSPSYLDLGAHHPTYLSNTKIFYDLGSRGINVEADPALIERFYRERRGDFNLNVGVASNPHDSWLPFYVMSIPTMNTFSRTEAERLARESSLEIIKVIEIPVKTVASILDMAGFKAFPQLLSVDLEGLDHCIVDSLSDYEYQSRPVVICIETIKYSEYSLPVKDNELIESMLGLGYIKYSDTWINTIFVRADVLHSSYVSRVISK